MNKKFQINSDCSYLAVGNIVRNLYNADPEFRRAFKSAPDDLLSKMGLNLSGMEAEMLISSSKYTPEEQMNNPYVLAYLNWLNNVHEYIDMKMSEDAYVDKSFYKFALRAKKRQSLENATFSLQRRINYYPVLFELSGGCSMQCNFCGLRAPAFEGNFEYNNENKALWKDILIFLKDTIGDIMGVCSCYFSTEPFDNPDYLKFLKDFYDINGAYPQTTTVCADLKPDFTRELMKLLGKEWLSRASIRASVRTLNQLNRMYEIFSPEELEDVEIICNNPESLGAYSLSGRVLDNKEKFPKEKPFINYSISCLAGMKINMYNKTISLTEPVTPSEQFLDGILVHETVAFEDFLDFKNKFTYLKDKYIHEKLPQTGIFYLNPAIKLSKEGDKLSLTGDKAGLKIKDGNIFADAVKLLANETLSLKEIKDRVYATEYTIQTLEVGLETLFDKGYILWKYSA